MQRSQQSSIRPPLSAPIRFPDTLPVSEHIPALTAALAAHQVLVVVGETGSGKTTQLPKLCLEAGYGRNGAIYHTQPRRLAARGVTARLNAELETIDAAGLRIRFDDQTSERNYVQVMTDGVLLAELARDPMLKRCEVVIVDEAHERSLNIDFLLGLLKRLLAKRSELRLIITSATIAHEIFAQFFQDAPVFDIPGRRFPVEVSYHELTWPDQSGPVLANGIVEAVTQIYAESSATLDTLVFLPGEREIREAAQQLRRTFDQQFEILPLYARLAATEQAKIFRVGRRRRIILATNVAETSLTVPGIGFVIDSGLARISRYSARRNLQQLPIEAISQANAAQRAGRCGRIAPGHCYRLYSEADFASRAQFPEAEIHRTHLGGVILQMLTMGLGSVEEFPFLEPPSSRAINDGYRLLAELGATDSRQVTPVGRRMAPLPLDPRLSRMLLAAIDGHCCYEAIIIAAGMSVGDVLNIPKQAQAIAIQRHGRFLSRQSDYISMLLLWHRLEWHRQQLTRKQFGLFCEQHFVSLPRFFEWRDICRQLRLTLTRTLRLDREQLRQATHFGSYLQHSLSEVSSEIDPEPLIKWGKQLDPASMIALHQPLLLAYATLVAKHDYKVGGYLGARQLRYHIHPSAWLNLHRSKSIKSVAKEAGATQERLTQQERQNRDWIVATDVVETDRVWAHRLAFFDIDWLLPLVGHLIRYTYHEPHWSKRRGAVMAYRSTLLQGMLIKQKELVQYQAIEPALARSIFIQTALVERKLGEHRFDPRLHRFLTTNEQLLVQLETLQARARSQHISLPDELLYGFFDERVPADILERRSFYRWWKSKWRTQPDYLCYQADWLEQAQRLAEPFPTVLQIGAKEFQLHYLFDPGHVRDGLTLEIAELDLFTIRAPALEWLVPGMLAEKCEALLRSLPKTQRKRFAPIADCVTGFVRAEHDQSQPLTYALAAFAGEVAAQLEWGEIEPHLRMNIALMGANGQELAVVKSLSELQQRAAQVDQLTAPAKAEQIVASLNEMPKLLQVQSGVSTTQSGTGANSVPKYQTLELKRDDTGKAQVLRATSSSPDLAEQLAYDAILHLVMGRFSSNVKAMKQQLAQHPSSRQLMLDLMLQDEIGQALPVDKHRRDRLLDRFWEVLLKACAVAVFDQNIMPVEPAKVQQFLAPRDQFPPMVNKSCEQIRKISELTLDIETRIAVVRAELRPGRYADQDVLTHYDDLLSPKWLTHASPYNVKRWLILVQALAHRLERRLGREGKDEQDAKQLVQMRQHLEQLINTSAQIKLSLRQDGYVLIWLVQELRLALFAQHLKPLRKISLKSFRVELDQYEQAVRQIVGQGV